MTMKMLGGLVAMMSLAAVVVGCSGGTSAPPDDSSQADSTPPSGASLPKKTDSAPGKPGAQGSTPTGQTAPQPGATPAPGTTPTPADPGQPGQNGSSGRSSDGNTCCYNNVELACDEVQCFGGYDENACEAKCGAIDIDCIIKCVDGLDSAPPPTKQCKATGNKC